MKEINGKPKLKIKKLPHSILNDEKEKDFSRVFDTVNYKILIRKFEKYEIKHQYIDCVKSHLDSWKQHICNSEGTLLSLIFVDDFSM